MPTLQPLEQDPTIGKVVLQTMSDGDKRKVRVLRYEVDDMNEGYAVRIVEPSDPSFGSESWMSAANVAAQLGSDDEFRRLRMFADQKITHAYSDLDQDVRDLFAERDALAARVQELEAIPNPTLVVNPEGTDTLQILLDRQRKLMGILGIPELKFGEEYLTNRFFLGAVIGIVSEAAEVLDAMETASKPWKQVPLEKMRALVLEEYVDVLFMCLEFATLAGLTPGDILQRYDDKLKFNLGRVLRTTNNNHPEASLWLAELVIRDTSSELAGGD